MRYPPDHKKRTRERVLSAAESAILSQGPHKLTVTGVMSAAGLTHGGFYDHFASRDDLVAETIGQMFAAALTRLEGFTIDATPRQALRAYITWYLSTEHRDARQRGCPLAALAGDLTRLPARARTRAAEGHGRLIARLGQLLEAIGHPGGEPAAMAVLGEMLGGLASARAFGEDPRSDVALGATRAHLLTRLRMADYP